MIPLYRLSFAMCDKIKKNAESYEKWCELTRIFKANPHLNFNEAVELMESNLHGKVEQREISTPIEDFIHFSSSCWVDKEDSNDQQKKDEENTLQAEVGIDAARDNDGSEMPDKKTGGAAAKPLRCFCQLCRQENADSTTSNVYWDMVRDKVVSGISTSSELPPLATDFAESSNEDGVAAGGKIKDAAAGDKLLDNSAGESKLDDSTKGSKLDDSAAEGSKLDDSAEGGKLDDDARGEIDDAGKKTDDAGKKINDAGDEMADAGEKTTAVAAAAAAGKTFRDWNLDDTGDKPHEAMVAKELLSEGCETATSGENHREMGAKGENAKGDI